MMPFRYQELLQTLAGYERSGVSLVAFDGTSFHASGFSDDVGLYLLVPWLVRFFDISLNQGIMLFMRGMVYGSVGVALIASLYLARSWVALATMVIGYPLVANTVINTRDVTLAYLAVLLACVPVLLVLADRASQRALMVAAPMLGVLLAGAHVVRAWSGLPVVVFAAVLFWRRDWITRRVAALTMMGLVAGGMVVLTLVAAQTSARDDFLATHEADFREASTVHPLWHTVYIGLGYGNDLGIAYLDQEAIDFVARTEPDAGYLSEEYEAALRVEVFRLVREHPGEIARMLVSKLVDSLRVLPWNRGLGFVLLVLLVRRRRPSRETIALIAAFGAALVPAMLAVPEANYLIGATASTALLVFWIVNEHAPRSTTPILEGARLGSAASVAE